MINLDRNNAQKKIKQGNWGKEYMEGLVKWNALAGEFRKVPLVDDFLTKTRKTDMPAM